MRYKVYFPVYQKRGYPFSYLVGYHFIGKNGKKYTTVKWKKRHNLKGRKLKGIR